MQNKSSRQTAGKLRLTLNHWYPLARYGGVAAAAMLYPQLPGETLLLPGITGSRRWIMLTVLFFLIVNLMLDKAWLNAYRLDTEELQKNVRNGGLHRQTLQAIASPLMFIADAAVIAYIYFSWTGAGSIRAESVSTGYHPAAIAAGVVLWIYGRALPKVPYGSIWGIRTKRSMASVQAWGVIHLKCVPWACIAGAAILIIGTFAQPEQALAAAGLICVAAFAGMFCVKAG